MLNRKNWGEIKVKINNAKKNIELIPRISNHNYNLTTTNNNNNKQDNKQDSNKQDNNKRYYCGTVDSVVKNRPAFAPVFSFIPVQ